MDRRDRAVENKIKKRLDSCSSVIVNYNSDWTAKSRKRIEDKI